MRPKSITKMMAGMLAGALALPAAEKVIPVTPQSVFAWSVTGEAPLTSSGTLILPAGTQLARKFESPSITVAFSGPVRFGRSPAETPVIEIGNAALVFMQLEGTGALVFVPESGEPSVVPVELPLDENGRAAVKSVSFTRSAENATVVVGETRYAYAAGPAVGPAEVVVTAGDAAWSFADLQVAILAPDEAATGADENKEGSGADETSSSAAAEPGDHGDSSAAIGAGAVVVFTGAVGKPEAKADEAEVSPTTLEVFTPPSVRHGNADAARSAAFGLTQQNSTTAP
jgi:hypothetical protein